MIKPSEICKKANAAGVRQQQIEKDYIISWILQGIAENPLLRDALIFKGGTCIKKTYFPDYRFSEDLDFTLNPDIEDKMSNDDLYSSFQKIFNLIKEEANIKLHIPEDLKEIHESESIKFFIEYTGPLGGKPDNLKVDITRGEQLEFEVEKRPVLFEYSDLEDYDSKINAYGLNWQITMIYDFLNRRQH